MKATMEKTVNVLLKCIKGDCVHFILEVTTTSEKCRTKISVCCLYI